MARHNPEDD